MQDNSSTLEKNEFMPLWAMLAFLLLIFVQLGNIMELNQGLFSFTLDDPYIHLALAENIMRGHYGINLSEYSSPSSSIIWPVLLAPVAHLAFAEYIILILNIICSLGVLFLFSKVISSTAKLPAAVLLALLLLVIPWLNLVGLVFVGMEHSLQVLLSCFILYGVVKELEKKTVNNWLWFCIIAAPLVRYECLAISIPASLFLFWRGYRKEVVLTLIFSFLLLALFSAFLMYLGLAPLSSSIMVKSGEASAFGMIEKFFTNTFVHKEGRGIFIMTCFLAFYAWRYYKKAIPLVFVVIGAVILHNLFGRYGWFSRYEIYILSIVLLASFHVLSHVAQEKSYRSFKKTAFAVILLLLLLTQFSSYRHPLVDGHIAAHNIYSQQYHMAKFAKIYNGRIAVNDLGLVTYRNDNYVLDLWGLGSLEALEMRKKGDVNWLANIVVRKDVGLVMIYEKWFVGKVPKSWLKLGDFTFEGDRITPADNKVAFYITSCDFAEAANKALDSFVLDIPDHTEFEKSDAIGLCGRS